jgi:hypothetical protein
MLFAKNQSYAISILFASTGLLEPIGTNYEVNKKSRKPPAFGKTLRHSENRRCRNIEKISWNCLLNSTKKQKKGTWPFFRLTYV